ncbi:MAG: polyprenyl synthetase family protein [Gemmatimonadota bacterium]|nr:polyprenyl synthetase family protein [Gemmatimonadota bacterium]
MGASTSARSTADAVASIAADREAVRGALAVWSGRYLAEGYGALGEAMRYSLLGPGKLLRPVLLLAAYRAAGGTGDAAALAAAVEVVHAYSLVHDDLPCMDDDAVRRGRPTTHKTFGPVVAALAGVAMVPLAARWACDAARALALPAAACTSIVQELMRASGASGMVGGQVLDLAGEAEGGAGLSQDELERIHAGKTGALMVAAMRIGGIAARCDPERLAGLARYGAALGLAFQIADDVLDATATTAQLGKTAGSDAARRKTTYAALLGVGRARARAEELAGTACGALAESGLLTPTLEHLARFAVSRSS